MLAIAWKIPKDFVHIGYFVFVIRQVICNTKFIDNNLVTTYYHLILTLL